MRLFRNSDPVKDRHNISACSGRRKRFGRRVCWRIISREYLFDMRRSISEWRAVTRRRVSVRIRASLAERAISDYRPSVSFWVYEAWVADSKAVIHAGSCGWCKDGQGCNPRAVDGKNGKWRGPFSTLALAEADASSTRRSVRQHFCVRPAH